jgi:excisionase family DNA binding protein
MTKPVTWTPTPEEALKRLDGQVFATVTEAAVILHLDSRALRKAIAAGDIPATRAGSTYRIPVAWLQGQIAPGAERNVIGDEGDEDQLCRA